MKILNRVNDGQCGKYLSKMTIQTARKNDQGH